MSKETRFLFVRLKARKRSPHFASSKKIKRFIDYIIDSIWKIEPWIKIKEVISNEQIVKISR
jgi:hypothetical protein